MKENNVLLPTIPIAKRVYYNQETHKQQTQSIRPENNQNQSNISPVGLKLEDSRLTQIHNADIVSAGEEYLCQPSSNQMSQPFPYKNAHNQNILIGVINYLNNQVRRMHNKIEELYNKIDILQQSSEQRIKKKRRKAQDIKKDFECPYDNCEKTYGTEVSLNLHIKLKHNGGTKTERQQLLRLKTAGQDVQMNINLPPEMLESFKENSASKFNI